MRWQVKHTPEISNPWTSTNHYLFTSDRTLVRFNRCHCIVIICLKPCDFNASNNSNAKIFNLLSQTIHRFGIVSVTTLLLMKDRSNTFSLPIIKKIQHVLTRLILPFNKDTLVANLLLLGMNLFDIFPHTLRRYLHIPDRVITECLWITFPNTD